MCEFFRDPQSEAHIPKHGPIGQKPSKTIYEAMGDEGIVHMIGEFYEKLLNSPISPMFKTDIKTAVDRSASFFVQLLGGPAYYNSKYGSPRMRMRHLPFRINEKHRLIWLECFYQTLDNPQSFDFPPSELSDFKEFLDEFSKWMVNSAD